MRNAPLNFTKPLNAKKRIAAEYADKGIDKQMIKDITADSGFNPETDTLIDVTNQSLRRRAIESTVPNIPYRKIGGQTVLKVQKDPFKNKFLPAEKEAVKTAQFGKATHGVKDLEDAYAEQDISRATLNRLNVQKGDTAIAMGYGGRHFFPVWKAQDKLAGETKGVPIPVRPKGVTTGAGGQEVANFSKQDLIDARKKDQELDALLPNMRRKKRNKRIRK